MLILKKSIIIVVGIVLLVSLFLSFNFSYKKDIKYGISFSRFHADELGLDWKETYLAILDDLHVRNFRFSAHWPLTEPEERKYNFEELDFQIREAKNRNASVILAVGRRLPGWPECHEPEWVRNKKLDLKNSKEYELFKQEKLLEYIRTVINRYKNYDNIIAWQVENEPYLTFFSRETCGSLDENLLDMEIKLVKILDPDRPILITDSGEIGLWFPAYKKSDIFGTSMYLYIWSPTIGSFRYPIGPWFFRLKHNLTRLFLGNKPSIIIELSAEPWLIKPIIDTPLSTQFDRMGIEKFNEMIDFSSETGFDTVYFWGAEWWYWLKLQGHDAFWIRAMNFFRN